jgi:hypothetical protein
MARPLLWAPGTMQTSRRSILAAAAFTLAVTASSSARADDTSAFTSTTASRAPLPPPTLLPPQVLAAVPATRETTWYGWQTLAADAAGLAVMSVAVSHTGQPGSNIGPLFSVGAGVYAFGPPAVHALQGRPSAALEDVALRLGAPLVTGLIGVGAGELMASGCHPQPGGFINGCALEPIATGIVGAFVGYVSAVAIDASVLSHAPAAKAAPSSASGIRWAPQVGLSPRGDANVGVAGSF